MRDPAVGCKAVRVMYGPRDLIVEEVRAVAACSPIVWLGAGEDPPAWQATRQLIAFAADVLAPERFEAALAGHRSVLALLYPEAPIALTEEQRARSGALGADVRWHGTHSLASWQPLIEAVAALLADLIEAAGAIVAVPELGDLDVSTDHALLEAFRVRGARLPGLQLGHDPASARQPARIWGVPVSGHVAPVGARLCDYQLCTGAEVVWLQRSGDAAPARGSGTPESRDVTAAPDRGWSARAPDGIAMAALSRPGAPSADVLRTSLAALRWASEVYAFAAACRIGVLLEPHRQQLDLAEQAEHAWLTAVAATNVHFVDRPTPGYDELLYAMYDRAIALTSDPVARASLAVRCAFATVDRASPRAEADLPRAEEQVRMIADLPCAPYYRAWLAVAHALQRMQRGDVRSAARFVDHACERLERTAVAAAWPPARAERLEREAACARFMILAHAAIRAGGEEDTLAARWLAQAEAARPRLPAAVLFEALHWVTLRQQDDDWTLLDERCRVGIRDAEQHAQSSNWTLYRVIAAQCAYRSGKASQAAEHCRALLSAAANRLSDAIMLWRGDVRPLALRAFLRAGEYAAVFELAQQCLADPGGPAPAEVHALAAWAHAAAGDAPDARTTMERAIDVAVDGGDQVTMLRVAMFAARVMLVLGDRSGAVRALSNAWELAEDEPGRFSSTISPQDRLRLSVLQASVAGCTAALLAGACALLPACVADAESWWDITELLDHVAEWHAHDPLALQDLRAGLAIVQRLARHRADWRASLDALD